MTRDGQSALNFEHAWGDGVAVMSYFNEVAKEINEKPFIHPDSKPANIDASQHVRRLGKCDYNLVKMMLISLQLQLLMIKQCVFIYMIIISISIVGKRY